MEIIENFAELSFEEQKKFAETLVNTINSEHTFTADTDFKLSGVEADELSGGLIIMLDHDDLIEVSREATWTCADEDEVHHDPGYEAEYSSTLFMDARDSFKTLEVVIGGYKVSLSVDDVDEEETIEVEVDSYSSEDGGIGGYEYWGVGGYDSSSYVEVEGTIVKGCSCALSLFVEPADEPIEIDDEDNSLDGDFDPDGRRTERPWDSEGHFED